MSVFKKSSAPIIGGNNNGGGNNRNDLTLIQKLRDRVFKHWLGSAWVRIMPAVSGSTKDTFLIKVPILKRGNHQAVCPSFFGQRSLFREAHKAIKDTTDAALASIRYDRNNNPNGFRSWPSDFYVMWVLPISPVGSRYELVIANASDGSYGPAQLGHKIVLAATRSNDDPSLPEAERGKPMFEDVSSIESGHHLNIKKVGEKASSSYDAEFSPAPSDITKILEGLSADEHAVICPIESALHCPTLEEQKAILVDLMGAEAFGKVFPDLV